MAKKSKGNNLEGMEEKVQRKKEYLQKVVEANSADREAKQIIDNEGLGGFAEKAAKKLGRRSFLRVMGGAGLGGAAVSLSLLSMAKRDAWAQPKVGQKPIRAALSSLIQSVLWTIVGGKAMKFYGEFLGFDIKIFDANYNLQLQREQLETIAAHATDYDVVFVHPIKYGAFTAPVKEIIRKGTPVVNLDIRLTENITDLDIITFVEVDNEYLATIVTEELCKGINYEGGIVESQGILGQSVVQARHRGFEKVVRKYPKIEVLDQGSIEFSVTKTREYWDDLLVKYGDRIKAGFIHCDDCALAAQKACEAHGVKAGSEGILLGGIDATYPVLEQVKKGRLFVTVSNPPCRSHTLCLWSAYWHIVRKEPAASIPLHQFVDGPVFSRGDPYFDVKVDAGIWQSKHYLV